MWASAEKDVLWIGILKHFGKFSESTHDAVFTLLRIFFMFPGSFAYFITPAISGTDWKLSSNILFSGPYFPIFGLNTNIYFVNLHIQTANTDQKKLHIPSLFMECRTLVLSRWNQKLFPIYWIIYVFNTSFKWKNLLCRDK